MTKGFRLARAVYSAAVCPEHPDPTITTFRVSLMEVFLVCRLDGRVHISMRQLRHGPRASPEAKVGNSNHPSTLGRRRSLHFRRGCSLRFRGSVNLFQLLGHEAADSEQASIVRQYIRRTTKQWLIGALE